jgi:hypothetical protein
MLLISLSAIYQAKIPILQYGQRHVDQLSRAHLRYVLTGELAPWVDKYITYLSDPHNTEDPEPHSKSYIAGGTEMHEQQLANKITKKLKTQQTKDKTPLTHHTHHHPDPDTHTPKIPMLTHQYKPAPEKPLQHNPNTDTHNPLYPMEITHPPPKPYKLRPAKVQKPPTRKRNTQPRHAQPDNHHQAELYTQTQPAIKHSSVAQAPPRINMAFPAPSVMPHRNPPMDTTKYKQTICVH